MRKFIVLILLFPVLMSSQIKDEHSQIINNITVDTFINSFYESQNNPEKLIPFFEESYFANFYKFSEHINLKNNEYGIFSERKTLKVRNSDDGNTFWRKYKIIYKKGTMIEVIEVKRTSISDPYKITCWKIYR